MSQNVKFEFLFVAFDCVNHKYISLVEFILSSELVLTFHAYLKVRHVKIKINDTFSNPVKVESGVPAGLDPWLFNLYYVC